MISNNKSSLEMGVSIWPLLFREGHLSKEQPSNRTSSKSEKMEDIIYKDGVSRYSICTLFTRDEWCYLSIDY